MRIDTPRHRPRLSRRDLLARDLSKILEHRPEHVRRQALRRRPVRELAVIQREDLPARPLHPLDHLQLDLQRAHQPIEIRHHKLIGPASLDHLNRRQQTRAPGQRQPAAHIDLRNRRGNKPLTTILRPPPSGLDLHLGRMKVLVLPIALLAHADDHDISELRHPTPLDRRLRLLGAYDPTGEKARAVKRRYQGVCRGCGAPTRPGAARATRTPTARNVIPARTRANGRASGCAKRCGPGGNATAARRPPMTGPSHSRAGAGQTHSPASRTPNGRRRAR